jgi:RNA polymerase sigma-70 factor (ECF subfamily)
VLTVVYLIFNEGYTATAGDRLERADLCAEAIRLGRLLTELMPDEPEAVGLLALMLPIESRRAARTGPDGALILLPGQDRSRWDRELIAEGQDLALRCLRRGQPGPYQIQAAISAVHSDAPVAAATDWTQILALYDQLMIVAPSPVVALNRAVAVAEVQGPAAGLALADGPALDRYYLFHAIRVTCCAASAARPRRTRLTPRRSGRPRTPPSATSSPGRGPSCPAGPSPGPDLPDPPTYQVPDR